MKYGILINSAQNMGYKKLVVIVSDHQTKAEINDGVTFGDIHLFFIRFGGIVGGQEIHFYQHAFQVDRKKLSLSD